MEKEQSKITKQILLENGWKETGNNVFPLEKIISKEPPEDEDDKFALIVHGMYNVWTFALLLPGGGIVNISPRTIEELAAFEKQIISYDPPF